MDTGNNQAVEFEDVDVRPVLTPDREEKRQNGRRMKENGEPAFALTAQDRHGVAVNKRIRRLTSCECEFLQGFFKNYTKWGVEKYGSSKKTDTDKTLQTLWETIDTLSGKGWGFAEPIALLKKTILRQELHESELCWEVEGAGKTSASKSSCQAIAYCERVRDMWVEEKHRHTPQEQEQVGQLIDELTSLVSRLPYEVTSERGRLEYRVINEKTAERIDGAVCFSLISDSGRYKVLGNAVTVNIVQMIAERLKP